MYSQSKFGSFALGSTPERISLQFHRLSARASQRWYIDDSESRVCFGAAVDMPCLRQEYWRFESPSAEIRCYSAALPLYHAQSARQHRQLPHWQYRERYRKMPPVA